MSAPTPPRLVEAFGKNAVDPDFINLIPVSTVDPGRASLDLGFPPQTMQPVIAGGTPPFGQDMNGILFMLSSHTVYQQAGTPYYYDATLSTALGGYALGTLLGMSDGSGFWINRTPNNTTNPDTGGAGWVPVYSYGPATVTGLTGGIVPATLTAAQAKKKLIILQGALTANLQVVVPNVYQDWLFVNQTTGAFTTTVKTSAGTGVVVPQGGLAAPVGVYCDTVNVYPTVAPLTGFSISQGPDPLTIVQRTNLGYILAKYINSDMPLDNLPMSAVYFEFAGDGYIRKMTLANFAAQIALSQFAGQVTNAQVPFSAVLQYAAALFTSPALTGTPTAPTAGIGANTTQIATTQFVMSQALGNAQSWSQPGRALNTAYGNTSGRAIQVNVDYIQIAGVGTITATVGGAIAAQASWNFGGSNQHNFMSFVVPPGQSYDVSFTGSGASLTNWSELS